MRIPSMDTIFAGADRLYCRWFRRGGLRITPLEGNGKFDPILATQTTNLILRELRRGKSSSSVGTKQIDESVGFDPVLATQTTNMIRRNLLGGQVRKRTEGTEKK